MRSHILSTPARLPHHETDRCGGVYWASMFHQCLTPHQKPANPQTLSPRAQALHHTRRTPARTPNPIEQTRIIHRDILPCNNLNNLLRDHASRQRRNIMQFTAARSRKLYTNLRHTLLNLRVVRILDMLACFFDQAVKDGVRDPGQLLRVAIDIS